MEVKKRNSSDLEWWIGEDILLKVSLLSWQKMSYNKVWRERERKEELGRFLLHSKKAREYP